MGGLINNVSSAGSKKHVWTGPGVGRYERKEVSQLSALALNIIIFIFYV